MKAVVLSEPRKLEYLTDAPLPKLVKGEALIKVSHIGICGSDVHIFEGNNPFVNTPIRLGHEFSGIVEKVGENAADFSVGDYVAIEPTIGCMKPECDPCQANRRNNCGEFKIIGCQADGAMAQYVSVPQYTLHKLPKGYDLKLAAMAEPASVGIHSARRGGAENYMGELYLVYGAGIIGIMAMSAIKYLSKERATVYAMDLSQSRLDLAAYLGIADKTINAQKADLENKSSRAAYISDLASQMQSAGIKNGFDVVIDSAGAGHTLEIAVNLARRGSGRVVQLGFQEDGPATIAAIRGERTIIGSRTYNGDDFPTALKMLSESNMLNRLQSAPGMQAIFEVNGLERIADEAFPAQRTGNHMKVLINVD